jgi:hypothetical protein
MSLVEGYSTFGPGLTFQKGPFKYKKNQAAPVQQFKWKGGGVPAGGQQHAGNGNWEQWMNPQGVPTVHTQPGLLTPTPFNNIVMPPDVQADENDKQYKPVRGRRTRNRRPQYLAAEPLGIQINVINPPGAQTVNTGSGPDQPTGPEPPQAPYKPDPNPPPSPLSISIPERAVGQDSPSTGGSTLNNFFDNGGYNHSVTYPHESALHSARSSVSFYSATEGDIAQAQTYAGVGSQTDPSSTRNFHGQTEATLESRWISTLEGFIYAHGNENNELTRALESERQKVMQGEGYVQSMQNAMRKVMQMLGVNAPHGPIDPNEFYMAATQLQENTLMTTQDEIDKFAQRIREINEAEAANLRMLKVNQNYRYTMEEFREYHHGRLNLAEQAEQSSRIETHGGSIMHDGPSASPSFSRVPEMSQVNPSSSNIHNIVQTTTVVNEGRNKRRTQFKRMGSALAFKKGMEKGYSHVYKGGSMSREEHGKIKQAKRDFNEKVSGRGRF